MNYVDNDYPSCTACLAVDTKQS